MALPFLRRTSALSGLPPQPASLLFKFRFWTKPQARTDTDYDQRNNCSCPSNHPGLWKNLLLPLAGRNTSEGFNIEIVDDDRWRVSSSLASVQDGVAESLIRSEKPAYTGKDETLEEGWCPEFDEIEDMRLRKKLFYKLERDSKEYEECSFNFYRKKSSSKGKEKKDVLSKKECTGKVDANQKLVHGNTGSNSQCGSFDERNATSSRKKERPKISASLNALCCENAETSDAGSSLVEGKPREIPKGRNTKTEIQDRYETEPDNWNVQTQFANFIHNKSPSSNAIIRTTTVPELQSDFSVVGFVDGGEEQLLTDGKKKRALTYNQLTEPYHLPFCLDIYITKGSVRACIVHRVTSKVVAVAHSISKDLKFDLKSRKDASACAAVGGTLAQRALADDIHNIVYTPRKEDKIEGKLQIVLESIIKGGIDVKVKLKQKKPCKMPVIG